MLLPGALVWLLRGLVPLPLGGTVVGFSDVSGFGLTGGAGRLSTSSAFLSAMSAVAGVGITSTLRTAYDMFYKITLPSTHIAGELRSSAVPDLPVQHTDLSVSYACNLPELLCL